MTAKDNTLANDEIKLRVISLRTDGFSQREIANFMGIPRSTIRDFLNQKSYSEWWQEHKNSPQLKGDVEDHHTNIKNLYEKGVAKKYILTSAQNNTFVHNKLLSTLEVMSKELDAAIIVGTYTYNLSGFQNLQKDDDDIWFDSAITQYISDEPIKLAQDLLWCGELNILPTAINPLSGFQSYVKESSGIVPHAKVQLESVPTRPDRNTRMLYTTGTVTKRNYIQKKAGQRASFHHIFGALLVEVDTEGDWFVRQLIADDHSGVIQDLDVVYHPCGKIERGVSVQAINWGDIHAELIDEEVAKISFYNKDSILDVLRPKYQFCHDTLNHTARNHHNIKDPYFRFKAYVTGNDYVEKDVDDFVKVLERIQRPFCQTVVVESNHDLALKRWLKEADYKTDPANAVFFLKCQLQMYKSIQRGDYDFSILEYLAKEKSNKLKDTIFLKTDESFVLNGRIECGSHGHLGNNGARGNINSYRILDARYNIGHSHSAGIKEGVYQAGHMMDVNKVEYTAGASSWSHSHIITYNNGKRTIVTIKNGKWKG